MSCPLCQAKHFTVWLYEDKLCYVCLCKTCNVPMVVLKRHDISVTNAEREHMLKVLSTAALDFFKSDSFTIDLQRRQIADHWHAHGRKG